jgi:hypothetical protein
LELKLFRVKHYISVYNLALEVTGASDAAKELAERVFENASRRFERHAIPENCDMYLAAQVYLLYALRNSPDAALKSTEIKTESSPAPNAARASSAPASADELAAISKSAPAARMEPAAAESPHASMAVPDLSRAPEAAEAVFDRERTEFWMPDSGPMRIQPTDAAQDESPGEEEVPDTPSVALSVLNTLLVLACLASVVFLLIEMNVFPKFL